MRREGGRKEKGGRKGEEKEERGKEEQRSGLLHLSECGCAPGEDDAFELL